MDENDVLALVRLSGGRVTKSRHAILKSLINAKEHITAEEVAGLVREQYPEIHLSTVYRNLEELEKLGVVVHTHFLHGPATYHLENEIHVHLVCESCGQILEVSLELLNPFMREIKKNFNFSINPKHFALQGMCGVCTKAES